MQDRLIPQQPYATPGAIPQPLLTIQALATMLGVSRPTVYALMRKGLPYVKIGGNLRFLLPSVLQWIAEHEQSR